MPTSIRIQVVSDSGSGLAPVTDADVVVGRRDLVGDEEYPYDGLLPTFSHDSNGNYVNSTGDPDNEPGEGEWLIVVRKAGQSTVAQKLTFVAKNGILRAAPGWNEPHRDKVTAATVSIVNFDEAKGSAQATQSLITTRLFPAQRFVGTGCRDNHGGTRFTLFAFGRRDHLFDLGQLNAGAIATLFDCRENKTLTTVKSARGAPGDWLVVKSVAAKDPDTDDPRKLSILDFYELLDQLGSDEPGTVIEAGVYGHAWHQGPIVQDDFDRSPDLDTRDTSDRDGRPKDWYPEGDVQQQFPNIGAAFNSAGRMVIWGCSHMKNITSEATEANRLAAAGAPRNQFFFAQWSFTRFDHTTGQQVANVGGRVHSTQDFAKRNIAQYVVSDLKGRFPEEGNAAGRCTYGGRMAQTLKGAVPCFVATPGMGANFGSVKGPLRKNGSQTTHISMLVVDQGENLQLKRYFEREYGSLFERDDHLYMNYTKFLDVTLPDPGWDTQRFAVYFFDDFQAEFLRLPSGLEIGRKVGAGGFDDPKPFQQNGEQGHVYVAKHAVASELQTWGDRQVLVILSDPNNDVGLFVTTTGKTFLLQRPTGKGNFGPPAVLPKAFTLQLKADPVYGKPQSDPGVQLTSNLLEDVTPQCYW